MKYNTLDTFVLRTKKKDNLNNFLNDVVTIKTGSFLILLLLFAIAINNFYYQN